MERELVIKYNWKQVDGSEVIEHHAGYLEETAIEHITKSLAQGYREGELTDNLHAQEDPDEHEGTEYRGYWSVSTK